MNFTAYKGELSCVVGRVGSGKSSFLQAILGDLWKIQGQVEVHGNIAYVAQQPWILNATVKENIVFFSDFAVRAAYAMGIPVSGPAPLPLEKSLWTVIKAPFAYKKHQENFERITSKRSVKVYDTNEEVIDKWLHYLRIHAMIGVDMKAEIIRRRPVGYGQSQFESAQRAFAVSKAQTAVEGGGAAKGAVKAVEGKASSSPT